MQDIVGIHTGRHTRAYDDYRKPRGSAHRGHNQRGHVPAMRLRRAWLWHWCLCGGMVLVEVLVLAAESIQACRVL